MLRLTSRARRRLVLAVAATLALASCARRGDIRASGTIEMDEIDVSSLTGGRLLRLYVDEGDSVRAGDTLALLPRGEVAADLVAQAARAEGATASYRDLQSGARPEEVLTARAELAAARADQGLAEADFQRIEKLAANKVVSQQELDRARATRDAAAA